MDRIVIAIADPVAQEQIRQDLEAEPETSDARIEIFGDHNSLMQNLFGVEKPDLLVVDYDISWASDSAGGDPTSQAVLISEMFDKMDSPPILILGPITRSNDKFRLSQLDKRVETIDVKSMFDLVGEQNRPLHVATILTLLKKRQTNGGEDQKPKGLVDLRIDKGDTIFCSGTFMYGNGLTEQTFVEKFALDSKLKEDFIYYEDVLEGEDVGEDMFLRTLKRIGQATRAILNFDAVTKNGIIDLLKDTGGVENIWFRFRISHREMAHVPFESLLRCDHSDELDDEPEFQLNYSPVYRVVSHRSRAKGENRKMPLLSGLCPNNPDRLKCLVIDATVKGAIKKGKYKKLPDDLPNISKHIKSEIELVTANLKEVEARGAIERFEIFRFDNEAKLRNPKKRFEKILKDCEWDIIHFCGHSMYIPGKKLKDDQGFIFLPGELGAVPLHIDSVADWFKPASLVYMSSCESAEPKFVSALADKGIPTIVGFRWQVSSLGASQFAGLFYSHLFEDKTGDIESAFVQSQRSMINDDKYPVPDWLKELAVSDPEMWENLDVKAGISPLLVMQNV